MYYALLVSDKLNKTTYVYDNVVFHKSKSISQFEDFIKNVVDSFPNETIHQDITTVTCKIYSVKSELQEGWIWNSESTKKKLMYDLSLVPIYKDYHNSDNSDIRLKYLVSNDVLNNFTQTEIFTKNSVSQTITENSDIGCQSNGVKNDDNKSSQTDKSLYTLDNSSSRNLNKQFLPEENSNTVTTQNTQTNMQNTSFGFVIQEFLDELQDTLSKANFGLV